ncbi:MAG: helix-turn-helix transcriptional regulator [Bacteroidetes bacterium]|nr:helix-turn-helix transcriptional regulator [Bacteroidota bacterium]
MTKRLYDKDIKRLELIQQYITANLDKDLRIDTLAQLINVGASTLRTHFSIHYKQPIHQYIRICRLNRARELLLQNHLTVAEIAATVGFKERTSFTRVFTRYIGCSPIQFKSLAAI